MVADSLWQIADEIRGTPRGLDIFAILEEASKRRINFDINDVRAMVKNFGHTHGELYVPEHITEFIRDYLSDRKVDSICDPWARMGFLIIPVAEQFSDAAAYAFDKNHSVVEAARLINTSVKIRWICKDPLIALDKEQGPYDVILSCPPFGLRPSKASLRSPEGLVDLHDNLESLALLKSCTRLGTGGVGLFIVPNSFMLVERPRGVRANLEKFGLAITSCLSLCAGTFSPLTGISTNLIIVEKAVASSLFVGELSENPDRRATLLANLLAQREGKELALGRFVDQQTFRGYPALETGDRIRKMARRLNMEAVSLSDLAVEMNLTKAAQPPSFQEHPNTVYLPLIGRSNAVNSLSELRMKPHNYIQLVIRPEMADAGYVAGFFNTPLGLLIREQACTGATIPKISKSPLVHTNIYIPDLPTQMKTIEGDTKIKNITNELNELHQSLWSQPGKLEKNLEALASFKREEGLNDWLDSLPYPLAIILWTYQTSGDDHKRRYEHLLHFFEALAEFMAIVLLSGFASNEDVFKSERPKLKEVLARSSLTVERSSFGTWKSIVEYLSKRGRDWLKAKSEERELCHTLFKTGSREILDVLFLSDIVGLLQETNSLRNQWSGHGGIVSDRTARERHVILEAYLSKVREHFGRIWERHRLIQPISCKIRSGIYYNRAHLIMGTRTPFEQVHQKTTEPLDSEKLYLITPDEPRALQLLPLIKVMPSPSKELNACYFYNRRQKDGIRFVSYHFAAEADIIDQFEDTAKCLERIQQEPTRT